MLQLSDRQKLLLKVIIEEYVKSAELVGSETIVENYDLGVSSATIRNEMGILTEQGFLKQVHSSSGRIPTSMGFRYYIKDLMQEKAIPVASEVAIKQRLYPKRFEREKLLHDTVKALAEHTGNLAVATTQNGDIYHAGAASILDHVEFFDIDLARAVLNLLDQDHLLTNIFSQAVSADPVAVLIGEEISMPLFSPCAVVFTHYHLGSATEGTLGVLGPARMDYPTVMSTVRYFGDLLNEIARSW